LFAVPPLRGAGGPATDLAARSEEMMQNENYAKAAQLCEQFLKEYPTGGDGGPDMVFKVRYNLAWCYYLTSEYPKAIAAFKELASDKVPSPELKEQASQLIGDAYSRYAGSLQDPKDKKENYNKAIETYTKFISGYPNSVSMPDVLYGRGLAFFRVDKYENAEKDLQTLLEKFPLHELKLDAQYLLATVLGTHGATLKRENKADEASKYLGAARDLFKQIIASNDIALANDAAYAAGEIFIQLKEYETAISYYRSVRNREEVLNSQKIKVDTIRSAFAKSTAGGDKRRVEALRSLQAREKSKLREIQSSPDLLLAASVRIADCYFQQKKYPEARVMYRFVLPHARLGDKDVAKAAASQIVATYIGEYRPAEAKQAFEEFEQEYNVDPVAESFGLAIGDLFLRKGKAEEAREQLEKNLKDFPNSSVKSMSQLRLAQALDALNRSSEATKLMEDVKTSDLQKTAGDEVNYTLGKVLKSQGKYDDALKALNLVSSNFDFYDDVRLQIALCYQGKKETDKAIELLQKFVQDFQGKSERIPFAMFQIGRAYEAKDDIPNAVKTYGELVNKHANDKYGPLAQYQIAIVYYNKANAGDKSKWEEMVKAFEELIKKFPKDTLVCDAHFWIGFKFQQERNYPPGIEQFETVVRDCHDNNLAPDAQYRIGNSWQTAAFAMGKYKALEKDKQAIWRDWMAKGMNAYERILSDYPASTQLDASLEGLAQMTLAQIQAELETVANAEAYFSKLSSQHADKPDLSARILLGLASIYYEVRKPEEAIRTFAKAFEGAGEVTLPSKYYEQYGNLLTEGKKCDEGESVYLRMQDRFKDEAQTQANAVWGLGNLYLQCGIYEKAVAQFDLLINKFPWHPHAADAQFGKGLVLESQKQWDQAQKIYEDVAVKLRGDARIRSLLGIGRCQMQKGDCKSALENFLKVSFMYEKQAEFACEGLWLGGQCYEKLAAINPPDRDKAIGQYRDLVQKYPNCKYLDDAKKRLGELTGGK
jgi:tetratricopeptide (TPR) repeat protein